MKIQYYGLLKYLMYQEVSLTFSQQEVKEQNSRLHVLEIIKEQYLEIVNKDAEEAANNSWLNSNPNYFNHYYFIEKI